MTDTWRFIDSGPCSAAYNMALDEAVAHAVRKESAPPTLRFYGWDVPSVSIGCFQKAHDIDTIFCRENRIPLVRRMTGGRAVLHYHELTYSFSVKTASGPFSQGLLDSYKKISSAFGLALLKTGISPELKLQREAGHCSSATRQPRSPSCFQSTSYGEISVNSIKIIGSAQKRWPDGLLQQGSIPLSQDENAMAAIFRLGSKNDTRKSSVGLTEIVPELDIDSIKDSIRISFEETFNAKFTFSVPSKEEIVFARELEAQKYLSPRWTFKR